MSVSARNWAWDCARIKDTQTGETVRDLKPGEKLVLLCIAEHENVNDGYAWPSMERIAERTGLTVRSVQTHVATLLGLGAMTKERRRSPKGTWTRNVYVLNVPEKYRVDDPQRWNPGDPF